MLLTGRKPLAYFVERYNVDYLVLDLAYVSPKALGIETSIVALRTFGAIAVYEFARRPAQLESKLAAR